MGKKLKTGKQRKDKYYKLAKETGFRSRAAFKLIQLNRKFEFLQKSRVLVDLCAAPGGWLQVAQKYMPVSSLIIGVDLVPIKPIPNVITLQEDITTERCYQALKKELKTVKVQAVLHDGAPNVGKSWVHDAFAQAQLTLSALKLATKMLVKGGCFITKIFRSKDYNSLLWVFKKLFKLVHVTKPQASRHESAEIFLVCEGYTAPDKIDPKFLDSEHLFEDVDEKGETKASILQIKKPKQKAEGYPEGDSTVFQRLKASDFIFSNNFLDLLSKCSEIIFDDSDIRDHRLTTDEIKECCKDVKVLGRSELRMLLNWRKLLRKTIEDNGKKISESSTALPSDTIENTEEKDIILTIKEAEELQLNKSQEFKRKKKKFLKERKKINEKINLKMIIKNDEPIIQEDNELFNLSQIKSEKDLTKLSVDSSSLVHSDSSKNLGDKKEQFKKLWVSYNRHEKYEPWDDNAEHSESSSESEITEKEIQFPKDRESEDDSDDDDDFDNTGVKNPLIVDLVDKNRCLKQKISNWFEQEGFADIPEDDDLEMEILAENIKIHNANLSSISDTPIANETEEKIESPEIILDDEIENEEQKSPEKKEAKPKRKKVKLDIEGLALGSLIIQSKKTKRDIIDNAYNRYTSNDEGLPDWFVKDEERHYRKQLPVTADMVAEYKERLKEINARPIKKVVEAKARRKRKAMKRLERARKKAEAITENLDMTEKEKAAQIKTIYKKAQPKKDNNVTYVVAKKGLGRRIKRPAGIKGKYKLVDKRMRKDNRKDKIEAKKQHTKKPPKGNFKGKRKQKGKRV